MPTANDILEIARSQIGTKESPAKSDNVKYNTAYYGREVSDGKHPWCAVFVWWVFREAGASDLYYGGDKTAYCPTLMSFHKKQAVTDYRPGDIVFFNFSGRSSAGHVGICESWDGTYITTIDGNTGSASEDNGGAVLRRRRHKKFIVGAYRPEYQEDDDMTQDQFNSFMDNYLKAIAKEPASDWAKPFIDTAIDVGAMTDVGGTIERPKSWMTREELSVVVAALARKG
jgi:hypothetical protein